MPGAQFEAEALASLNSELEAIRELERTSSAAIKGFNKEVGDANQSWSNAFRIRAEDPDYRFLDGDGLLNAVKALPEAIEDRAKLGKQILDFTANVNAAITRKSDGSLVEGSINPLDEEYVGDHEDLPALFLATNGVMLGRIVTVKHSELSHTYRSPESLYRMGLHESPDPLKAMVWPYQTDIEVLKSEMGPEEVGFLLSSATFVGGDKNDYVLPDPSEYITPLEPAID